ncbi:MAG: LuxR C-terminal-related transcriptional regulator [Bacteroidaceae bacterium]|nr:LuxR C-terminal-related transcriptional regulator [Bacteroidaceae bacterium]
MELAIIDSNILTCMGLQQILRDIMPSCDIRVFRSYEELVINQPERFGHYFVSSGIYFEHAQFFITQPHRSIVLVYGDNYPRLSGLLTLNVSQSEQGLVKDILNLHNRGISNRGMNAEVSMGEMPANEGHHPHCKETILTTREAEVAVLLAKGYINKEIADRLNISLTTVISHRKNIMEKLNARSLADIIIHVVMHGLVRIEDL